MSHTNNHYFTNVQSDKKLLLSPNLQCEMVRSPFLTTPKNYDFHIFLGIEKYRDISKYLFRCFSMGTKIKTIKTQNTHCGTKSINSKNRL